MKRLFISLYLLICLAILGLGWALENLWESSFGTHEVQNAPVYMLANMVKQLPVSERFAFVTKAGSDHKYPMELMNKQAMPAYLQKKLLLDQVLTDVDEHNNRRQYFLLSNNQVLLVGPIHLKPLARWETTFTILFYFLLALVVLLWIKPLSRDIKRLEQAARDFGQAKWQTRIRLPKSSQVLSLGVTFNKMAKQISSLIDNQKHLTNAVSHEIRTPLARLKFAMALLPSYASVDKTDEQRSEFIDGMQQDVQEIDNLLAEMLTYASLESAQQGIELENTDLVILANQLIDRLRDLSAIPISLDSKQASLVFPIEPALIERALQNLITNAQRYAKSFISIRISQCKQQVCIAVIDDGCGIPEEEQQKIFEPYYRSKQNRAEDKGYGLGLAIIVRIMQRAGGKVTLESRAGYTCFSLCWPTANKDDASV